MNHLFVDYANFQLSLPVHLVALYQRIDDSFDIPPEVSRKIIRIIIEIKSCNFDDRSSVFALTEKLQAIPEIYDIWSTKDFVDSLPDSFYKSGHKINDPEVVCSLGHVQRGVYMAQLCLKDGEYIKCYECDQIYFRSIIAELAKGKERSQICGINNVESAWVAAIGKKPIPSPDKKKSPLSKETMDVFSFFKSLRALYWNSASFKLIEFLRDSNQSKISVCELCKVFYIAKKADIRNKYCPACSPKSKISKKRRNELAKIRRKKQKQDKIAKERKEKIKKYIDHGNTREEAEEIYEADKKM